MAVTPLNFNTVGPLLRLAPLRKTAAPGLPMYGTKLSMIGARVTTKSSALTPTPKALVTVIRPLLMAVAGTKAKIWLSARGPQFAALPLNPTPVIFVKLIPSMVTAGKVDRGTPTLGKKLVTTGARVMTKASVLLALVQELAHSGDVQLTHLLSQNETRVPHALPLVIKERKQRLGMPF